MRALIQFGKRRKELATGVRALASAEPAVVEESPFLRFGSLQPQPTNYTPILGSIPQTRVTTLSNGLRVATETQPFAQTATVGVWIDAGSRFETASNNGTAHFLEHMAFKGTKARSTRALEVEVENMGGHLNAYTSRESTCFFAKVMKDDVGKAVDILADIMQNPVFDDAAIERERSVILREMEEVEKQTEEVLFDHLHATAFQTTPLGRTILGSADNIKSISREDLVKYIATHYTGSRMVLSAAGALDHDDLVKLAEAKFSKLQNHSKTASELVSAEPTIFTGSEVRIRNPDEPLVHMAIAYKGASWTDPDAIPLMVMQSMLGGWNKRSGTGADGPSQLSQRCAANELADSYNAFNTNYHDSGLFGMYAIAPKDKLEDLSWSIMQEITRMCYNVGEEEVTRAKNRLKTVMIFQTEGTTGTAEDIGRQMLVYGRRIPKAELFARIDAVNAETVKEVADRFLYDQELAITAIGDTQDLPDYNWLRRKTYWLRY
ncbi:hypothetical protein BSKO_00939 [Bryopsis sp. KO-2023]|nr:hypothetical protein BSKO_00939 [Bryopsis sp. KO-2023]